MLHVPREPPTHEELDRQRRFLEAERISFEWEKLQREQRAFHLEAKSAVQLLELAHSKTTAPVEALDSLSKEKSADEIFDEIFDEISSVPADPMIERRVCRYWEGSKRYFTGTVVASDVTSGGVATHCVRYDDGEEA
jgi:hypothetical protein